MNARSLLLLLLPLALLAAPALLAGDALAEEPAPQAAAPDGAAPEEAATEDAGTVEATKPEAGHKPGRVLAMLLFGVVVVGGLGCMISVLSVIFPGPARRADEAIARLHTGRLLLTGLLPLVGAGLLGAAAEQSGVPALQVAWGILVGLPITILVVVGALAAVPYLGGAVLRGEGRSLLARSLTGALVLGFGLGTLGGVSKEIGSLLGLVVLGWFLGAGLGVLFRPRSPAQVPPSVEA